MNDNLLVFYAFKWQRQRQMLCASFITKKLFSYSVLRQHWTCSHEGLLHYWFNPLHWCDHFTDRHTIFRDHNNVYKNVSTLWHTGSTKVLHFHSNSNIQFLKYFVFCNIFKYIHKRTEKNVLKHQSNPTWECMLCVKYVITLGCCW